MAIELVKNNTVTFEEGPHTYTTEDGLVLSGVTSLINRHLFPDKYGDVPEDVLAKAAERGTRIHKEVQEYNDNGTMPQTREGLAYVTLKDKEKLKVIASEYLVSDNQNFATLVDIVVEKRKKIILIDTKTNRSGADVVYLQWQLSCNAYLFELQNPGLKVSELFGLWLNDDTAELIPINRIDDKHIKDLMEADALGLPYLNPFVMTIPEDDTKALMITEARLQKVLALSKKLEDVKKGILGRVQALLEEQNSNGAGKTIENDFVRFTLVEPSESVSVDGARLKKEKPEIYADYTKLTKKKGYVKMTLKGA